MYEVQKQKDMTPVGPRDRVMKLARPPRLFSKKLLLDGDAKLFLPFATESRMIRLIALDFTAWTFPREREVDVSSSLRKKNSPMTYRDTADNSN